MGHIYVPKFHVSITHLVRLMLAMTMEIWNPECGPFWTIFAVFAIFPPRSEYHISMGQETNAGVSGDSCSI